MLHDLLDLSVTCSLGKLMFYISKKRNYYFLRSDANALKSVTESFGMQLSYRLRNIYIVRAFVTTQLGLTLQQMCYGVH